jgi:flagellar hook-length control protein FliK
VSGCFCIPGIPALEGPTPGEGPVKKTVPAGAEDFGALFEAYFRNVGLFAIPSLFPVTKSCGASCGNAESTGNAPLPCPLSAQSSVSLSCPGAASSGVGEVQDPLQEFSAFLSDALEMVENFTVTLRLGEGNVTVSGVRDENGVFSFSIGGKKEALVEFFTMLFANLRAWIAGNSEGKPQCARLQCGRISPKDEPLVQDVPSGGGAPAPAVEVTDVPSGESTVASEVMLEDASSLVTGDEPPTQSTSLLTAEEGSLVQDVPSGGGAPAPAVEVTDVPSGESTVASEVMLEDASSLVTGDEPPTQSTSLLTAEEGSLVQDVPSGGGAPAPAVEVTDVPSGESTVASEVMLEDASSLVTGDEPPTQSTSLLTAEEGSLVQDVSPGEEDEAFRETTQASFWKNPGLSRQGDSTASLGKATSLGERATAPVVKVGKDATKDATASSKEGMTSSFVPARNAEHGVSQDVRVSIASPKDFAKVFEEVLKVASDTKGQKEVVLRLEPEHLGAIVVRLEEQEGQIRCFWEVPNPETRELLLKYLPALEAHFNALGMPFANFFGDGQNTYAFSSFRWTRASERDGDDEVPFENLEVSQVNFLV